MKRRHLQAMMPAKRHEFRKIGICVGLSCVHLPFAACYIDTAVAADTALDGRDQKLLFAAREWRVAMVNLA